MPAVEFQLLIAARQPLTPDITEFTFRPEDGRSLPVATPGSHITLATPSGARRRYSITNPSTDQVEYKIAVKREESGRGGSISLVDDAEAGHSIAVQAPQNDFALSDNTRCLFIAGGIGITPILSMVRHKRSTPGPDFSLHYLTRDKAHTAYVDELADVRLPGDVQLHYDQGLEDNFFDLWPLLEEPDDRHVYYCGPHNLMEDIAGMTGHWPADQVHFESFAPVVDATHEDDHAFTIVCQRSGARVTVPANQSALAALRQAGIAVSSSCESGTCGSCKTTLLEGEVNHRDLVLRPDEQASHIMLCVSRAMHSEITVDL